MTRVWNKAAEVDRLKDEVEKGKSLKDGFWITDKTFWIKLNDSNWRIIHNKTINVYIMYCIWSILFKSVYLSFANTTDFEKSVELFQRTTSKDHFDESLR